MRMCCRLVHSARRVLHAVADGWVICCECAEGRCAGWSAQAVAEVGKKWSQVALHVPGRTDVQCRERYVNILDPDLNPNPWTEGVPEHPALGMRLNLIWRCWNNNPTAFTMRNHGGAGACFANGRGGRKAAGGGEGAPRAGRRRPVGRGPEADSRPDRQRMQAALHAAQERRAARHDWVRSYNPRPKRNRFRQVMASIYPCPLQGTPLGWLAPFHGTVGHWLLSCRAKKRRKAGEKGGRGVRAKRARAKQKLERMSLSESSAGDASPGEDGGDDA